VVVVAAFTIQVCAQKNAPPPIAAPLVLTAAVPLANVKGHIDHFGFDPTHNRLFVSALGNNTEEIIGIGAQTVVHTISGVPTPQGVAYSPKTNKLFVGSDEGKLYVYDGTTFDLITSIDFGDDVDDLRYDAAEKRLYVGYGDEKTGAIGMVDAATNKRIDGEYKLGAHPESFQLAASGPNIYVNLPDLKQIAVVNRITEGVDHVDYGILRTIKHLSRHLEVSECSEHQWQDAILQGFSVWRQLQKTGEGNVVGDVGGQNHTL
jgi:hypothetical protein